MGKNGSGKSAILTGIQFALGCKASAAGRGSSYKHFIRHGQDCATVKITLSNRGHDAFKVSLFLLGTRVSPCAVSGAWVLSPVSPVSPVCHP